MNGRAEKVPGAKIFSEGSDLIKSGVCEAVLIAVPHYQHPELTILALQNNLHVLCEKACRCVHLAGEGNDCRGG